MNIAEVIDPQIAGREQIIRDAKERVGTVYEIDIIAKDGRRIPLEMSTRVVLCDGERIEVQGIAVPSVIRNQSSFSTGLPCSDSGSFYGNSSGPST